MMQMDEDLNTTTIIVLNGVRKKIIIMNKKYKNYEQENYTQTYIQQMKV